MTACGVCDSESREEVEQERENEPGQKGYDGEDEAAGSQPPATFAPLLGEVELLEGYLALHRGELVVRKALVRLVCEVSGYHCPVFDDDRAGAHRHITIDPSGDDEPMRSSVEVTLDLAGDLHPSSGGEEPASHPGPLCEVHRIAGGESRASEHPGQVHRACCKNGVLSDRTVNVERLRHREDAVPSVPGKLELLAEEVERVRASAERQLLACEQVVVGDARALRVHLLIQVNVYRREAAGRDHRYHQDPDESSSL